MQLLSKRPSIIVLVFVFILAQLVLTGCDKIPGFAPNPSIDPTQLTSGQLPIDDSSTIPQTPQVNIQNVPMGNSNQWYVSVTGSDANDCRSTAKPCRNVQTAIDRAASGDNINLSAGTFDECLVAKKSLSFVGKGIDVSIIDGDKCDFGVFWFEPENQSAGSLQVSMASLTIQNGITNVNNYGRPQNGGGISAENTDLYIQGVRFYNNLARLGGAIYFSFLMGSSPDYSLVLKDVVFDNNIAHDDGGAIYIEGNLNAENVVFDHNSGDQGGSIYSEGKVDLKDIQLRNGFTIGSQIYNMPPYNPGNHDDFSVSDSIFENNEGSALWIRKGMITNTTISNNLGSGVYADLEETDLYIENSTISGNKPFGVQTSAGIWMTGSSGTLTLLNVTIAENQIPGFMQVNPTSVSVFNTLIANNTVGCTLFSNPIDFDSVFSGSNNISTDNTCGSSFAQFPNIFLGPLTDNGGGTLTHALLPGSPAIDNGREWKGLNMDQREQPRMVDGNGDGIAANDIGAFEAPAGTTLFTPTPVFMVFIPDKVAPCRQGPATLYAAVGMLAQGAQYEITGMNIGGNWYQILFAQNTKCWVRADVGKPSGDPALVPTILFTIATITPTITVTPTQVFDCSTIMDESQCNANPVCTWVRDAAGLPTCRNK